jgi:hypothetical protein
MLPPPSPSIVEIALIGLSEMPRFRAPILHHRGTMSGSLPDNPDQQGCELGSSQLSNGVSNEDRELMMGNKVKRMFRNT